jgi:NADH-quinone oxidoreductase subunit M
MAWFDNGWGLSLIVFLPIAGALVILLTPKKNLAAVKAFGLTFTALPVVLAAVMIARFDYGAGSAFQFGTDLSWIVSINARYHIGVDGISFPLLILSALLTMLSVIYTFNHWPEPYNPKAFMALILVLGTAMNGTFVSLDLVLFFVFFELVLLPMYFMIGIWGDKTKMKVPGFRIEAETRLYAAIKFFVFTLFGSAFMLLGFLALYYRSGEHLASGIRTFDIPTLVGLGAAGAFTGTFAFLVFGALFLGFAVKVPMWPLHTWLPDAHTAAPTVGSVLLAGILLKLGSYGFIRIALPILPDEARHWAPAIAVLAVIGIIYGALACLAQSDMKRLIAFSSVGHMGFVMLGISTLTVVGINAAVIGMVAHGLITGLLFFLAGSMAHRYHTREMSRLGGNQKLMPRMGGILGFTAIASLGLPGLAGFWGEFMSLVGSYNPATGLSLGVFRTAMVFGAIGTVLTAGYMLWMLQRVNLGEPSVEWESHTLVDADPYELGAWVPLMVFIVAVGVYPGLVFGATNGAVAALVAKAFGG